MIVTRAMVDQSIVILGLEGMPITTDTVKAAYRKLAKTAHPDVGGSAEQFAAADRARAILELHLAKVGVNSGVAQPMIKNDCPNCKGRGRVTVRRHWTSITITCGRCKGSGDANWDEDIQDS